MFRKMILILFASLFVFGMSKLSSAMMCGGHGGKQQLPQVHSEREHSAAATNKETASEEVVNVGNKICPVSGEKVGQGGMKPETYEFEGKIYNFCCVMCIEEFKKDPQKYIKKVEEELQAQSKGVNDEHDIEMPQESDASHRESHEGHQH